MIVVPAYDWAWSAKDERLGHRRRYTKARLHETLVAAGLEVERITYFHSWLAIVAFVMRRTPLRHLLPDDGDEAGSAGVMGRGFYRMNSRTHLLIGVVYLLLGAGLIARALVRTRPFVRGDEVRVVSTDRLVAEMTAAWAKSLGAQVVSSGTAAAIHDEPRYRRAVLGSRGKLAQAAVEVFQAIRAGVFDGVRSVSGGDQQLAA